MCSCSEPQRSNGDNAAQRRKAVQVRTQELVGGQLPLVASDLFYPIEIFEPDEHCFRAWEVEH